MVIYVLLSIKTYSIISKIIGIKKVILQESQNGQFFLTLPKSVVKAKKWGRGQKIDIEFNERGNLELTESKD